MLYIPTMLPALLIPFFLPVPSSAFNFDIHNQIGFMAETYLTPEAQYMVSRILEPEYNSSIGRAASWADTVSRTSHRYSYGWHWTSALDDPPRVCNIHPHRDCQAGGCSVSQLANQTSILGSCVERLPVYGAHAPAAAAAADVNTTCAEALKWVTHFVGDTAQPLHNSALALGGNTFPVVFNGTATSMHKAWDSLLLFGHTGSAKGFPQDRLDPYFAGLLRRTQEDGFAAPRESWGLAGEPTQALYWVSAWARDANALNCDVVYGLWSEGLDLWADETYRKTAVEILELQIAKAAWRLGGWLNGIAGKFLGVEPKEDKFGKAGAQMRLESVGN